MLVGGRPFGFALTGQTEAGIAVPGVTLTPGVHGGAWVGGVAIAIAPVGYVI